MQGEQRMTREAATHIMKALGRMKQMMTAKENRL